MPFQVEAASFFEGAFAITPSDGTALAQPCRAIFIGGTGNLTVITNAGQTVLFSNVPVGVLAISCSYVKATGTTATNLVGMY
jgi:hypothetical protein